MRVAVDGNAARCAQRLPGKAATKNANGGEPRLTCGLGVVGRITDHKSLCRIVKVKLVEGSLEDVWIGLRPLRII